MSNQLIFPRALDANGYIAPGAKARVTQSGTNTLITIYSDVDGTIAAANPVIANANGVFPQRYADVPARVAYTTAADETLYTQDPAPAIPAIGAGASQISFVPSVFAPATNVQDAIDQLADDVNSQAPDAGNLIINGAFDHWQRGTSFTTYNAYTADRWRLTGSGGTSTVSRISPNPGLVLGVNNPTFALRHAVSGQTGTDSSVLQQRIEGVRSYAGQTVTVLGWARRQAGSGNMRVQLVQNFGTGGSPSPTATVGVQQVTLTGIFAPFACTFDVPSLTGKTIGTNGDDFLQLQFVMSDGAGALGIQTITVDLWGIHMRTGASTTTATSLYVAPDLASELAKCQRYFTVGTVRFDGQATSGVAFTARADFKATMRSVPTVAETDVSSAAFPATTSAVNITTGGYSSRRVASATAGGAFLTTYTAEAEL